VITCIQCKRNPAASFIVLCADCIRDYPHRDNLIRLHNRVRKGFNLPERPPQSSGGLSCNLCANHCRIDEVETGYCGIRINRDGTLLNRAGPESLFAHTYLDALPTNCCASWFCRGSQESGYSLAVFLYGCSFDCLYCQNAEHKDVQSAPAIGVDELVQEALQSSVRCVCFFGGSPEPQLPTVLEAARRILSESGNGKHICWEWNGSGNTQLVLRAAELSMRSGGTMKFDLKAFNSNIHHALCGAANTQTLANFKVVEENFPGCDMLTATTLLVPSYVDEQEVASIASFIANLDPEIPYSLLVFHPDFYLDDLPITPGKQVSSCYDAAEQYLKRVNIGNRELL